ncbi:MAG: VIT1/CCC1 transporter family protein [Niabella sp.]
MDKSQTIQDRATIFIGGFIDGVIIATAFYVLTFLFTANTKTANFDILIIGLYVAVLTSLGAYFTRRAEQRKNKNLKIIEIYESLDIDGELKQRMIQDVLDEQAAWEKEWEANSNSTARFSATGYGFIVFLAYLSGMLIVLFNAYWHNDLSWIWFILPMLMLTLAGFAQNKLKGMNPWLGAAILLATGIVVAASTYLMASLIQNFS